jgi:hypothetical protein
LLELEGTSLRETSPLIGIEVENGCISTLGSILGTVGPAGSIDGDTWLGFELGDWESNVGTSIIEGDTALQGFALGDWATNDGTSLIEGAALLLGLEIGDWESKVGDSLIEGVGALLRSFALGDWDNNDGDWSCDFRET